MDLFIIKAYSFEIELDLSTSEEEMGKHKTDDVPQPNDTDI